MEATCTCTLFLYISKGTWKKSSFVESHAKHSSNVNKKYSYYTLISHEYMYVPSHLVQWFDRNVVVGVSCFKPKVSVFALIFVSPCWGIPCGYTTVYNMNFNCYFNYSKYKYTQYNSNLLSWLVQFPGFMLFFINLLSHTCIHVLLGILHVPVHKLFCRW